MRRQRRDSRRGQIALAFVVLMGAVLVFVGMTVNLGQMAQVRAAVSNAADAGALAGASWMASGQNEVALIARKMWDSIFMVQALMLVPFCPRPPAARNGQDIMEPIIARLTFNNRFRFRVWANAVMESAWRLGNRELFTASVNNMLIRFPCVLPAGGHSTVSEFIASIQEQATISTIRGTGFSWTNCMPDGDARQLIHVMDMDWDYPHQAPELRVEGTISWPYYEYLPPIAGLPRYDCRLPSRAVTNRPSLGSPPTDFTTPVGAVDVGGRKRWDIDLGTLYPEPGEMTYGSCPGGVCGMQPRTLTGAPASARVRPTSLTNGDGTVETTVRHEVNRPTGGFGWFGVPIWDTAFLPTGAQARARFRRGNAANGVQDASADLTWAR